MTAADFIKLIKTDGADTQAVSRLTGLTLAQIRDLESGLHTYARIDLDQRQPTRVLPAISTWHS